MHAHGYIVPGHNCSCHMHNIPRLNEWVRNPVGQLVCRLCRSAGRSKRNPAPQLHK